MRKKVFGRKLSRGDGARKALRRALISALVAHGAITTTKVKAKFVQAEIDKLINIAKKGDIAAKRKVYAELGNDKKTADGIFKLVENLFSTRNGGYTRIVNLPKRLGDRSPMAWFEWVEKEEVKVEKGAKSVKGAKNITEKIDKKTKTKVSTKVKSEKKKV